MLIHVTAKNVQIIFLKTQCVMIYIQMELKIFPSKLLFTIMNTNR